MKAWTPEAIKDFRKRLSLTQKDFAELVGVRRQYVNYIEKGVKQPGKTLKILLTVLEQIEKEKGR
jgi:DNA-binding XRE family transcriptional regulator